MPHPSTTHHSGRRLLWALVLLLALAAAACGDNGAAVDDTAADDTAADEAAADDDAGAEEPAADPATEDPATEAEAMTEDPATEAEAMTEDPATEEEATTEAAAGDAVVDVADSDLGQILVDADGMTLYGFTNDTDGTSSCTGDCAATWPPLIVEEGFTVADGLDDSLFSTTEREDGSLQLVAGDWPLYHFEPDTAPGDVNGQGVGGVWFVVDSSGALVREEAASTSSAGSDGYSY